ncbi:unnamed protein product [Absidia cylindrospora]
MSATKEPTPQTTPTKEEPIDKKEPKVNEEPLKNEQETDDSKVVNMDDLIDMSTFDQLLDMDDDDDDHEFSYSIVLNYFEQAEATFKDMDDALDKKNLPELSRLGHFLKGSSAAIGLKKVKATCERSKTLGIAKTKLEAMTLVKPML